jgi:hypothetical protein
VAVAPAVVVSVAAAVAAATAVVVKRTAAVINADATCRVMAQCSALIGDIGSLYDHCAATVALLVRPLALRAGTLTI